MKKRHCFPFKNGLLFPSLQYNVPESSQPATPAASAVEIVTLALDLSATAAAVAKAQRLSLGLCNFHSRHRLTEAYYCIACVTDETKPRYSPGIVSSVTQANYYIVGARLGGEVVFASGVCAKTPKCKIVQRLMSMIADSRPSKLPRADVLRQTLRLYVPPPPPLCYLLSLKLTIDCACCEKCLYITMVTIYPNYGHTLTMVFFFKF